MFVIYSFRGLLIQFALVCLLCSFRPDLICKTSFLFNHLYSLASNKRDLLMFRGYIDLITFRFILILSISRKFEVLLKWSLLSNISIWIDRWPYKWYRSLDNIIWRTKWFNQAQQAPIHFIRVGVKQWDAAALVVFDSIIPIAE